MALAAVSSLADPFATATGTASLLAAVVIGTAGYAVLARGLRHVIARNRRAAILDERRRLARDLHDGLAQELAYIRMESSRMAAAEPDGRAPQLALAADAAMKDLRAAIAALREESDDPFPVEVSRMAEHLAARAGARLSVHIDPAVEIDPEHHDPLLRIVREAITNGVSHGRASELWLELARGERLRLVVRDNGSGFIPDDADSNRDGFGLLGMRERVRDLGGDLQVRSQPGAGTEVEAELP
jgi:signal transduction histidine kinase